MYSFFRKNKYFTTLESFECILDITNGVNYVLKMLSFSKIFHSNSFSYVFQKYLKYLKWIEKICDKFDNQIMSCE